MYDTYIYSILSKGLYSVHIRVEYNTNPLERDNVIISRVPLQNYCENKCFYIVVVRILYGLNVKTFVRIGNDVPQTISRTREKPWLICQKEKRIFDKNT